MKSVFFLLGAFALMIAFPSEMLAQEGKKTPEWWQRYEEKEKEIYARMKRYGINRDDMADLHHLRKSGRPLGDPHIKIPAAEFLNPGEHYRFGLDEYIVTMLVPKASAASSWIWPYTNIRDPDAAMKQYLEREKGSLKIASMGWTNCLYFGCMNSRGDGSSASMTYRILSPEEVSGRFSTPEKLRQGVRESQKRAIEQALAYRGKNPIVSDAELEAERVALEPEIVTINGRIWVRDAMNDYRGRAYVYVTPLLPGRVLRVRFGMPQGHDYNAQPDPATWPRSAKQAFENMEAMVASLRVTKTNDDGSPDPFVVERVEPGPLPVREKRPAAD